MKKLQRILFCSDDEPHTRKAEDYALLLAKLSSADLVAVYVVDPYLKKFTNEIYAVSRDECRDLLDRGLRAEGAKALGDFSARASAEGIPLQTKMRYGDRVEEILKETQEAEYDLVIMGGKILRNWKERFESVNLPYEVFKAITIPLLVVR